ncbi:unnamed protein product [Orchesella dallaii]|uniref:Uncharacterized protein n=1 Tax=Orchesella dallaii TaxID=48710 RepID=A0ABP1S488_9HEXA
MKLLLLLLSAQCVLGAYEPWEDIKKSYENISYDRAAAEVRQKGFEDTCSLIANGQEGLCYDDCMLRTSYRLMEFGEGRFVVVTEYSVYRLEAKVLNLPKVVDHEALTNQALNQRIYSCRIEDWTSA